MREWNWSWYQVVNPFLTSHKIKNLSNITPKPIKSVINNAPITLIEWIYCFRMFLIIKTKLSISSTRWLLTQPGINVNCVYDSTRILPWIPYPPQSLALYWPIYWGVQTYLTDDVKSIYKQELPDCPEDTEWWLHLVFMSWLTWNVFRHWSHS